MESASSKIMILQLKLLLIGAFVSAKPLMVSLTTWIPLASEALSYCAGLDDARRGRFVNLPPPARRQ